MSFWNLAGIEAVSGKNCAVERCRRPKYGYLQDINCLKHQSELKFNIGGVLMDEPVGLSYCDHVWNRACEGGGDHPCAGDVALAAVILFHGPANNGGVLHATECLSAAQLEEARAGFRYYGFDLVADLLMQAEKVIHLDSNIGSLETVFDHRYWKQISDDSVLTECFARHFQMHPTEYSPMLIDTEAR